MRIKKVFLGLLLAFLFTPINNVFADAQNFYFEDFTADYYLIKLEDGTSKLHVKEVLTAIFPETDQNHGITRNIPFYNQDGENRTIASKNSMNLTVLRNGEPENINKIETEQDNYVVYIGDASEYVHGRQVYTLEYDYVDVIMEFDKNKNNVSGQEGVIKAFQELYWDTNGTAWKQKFDKLTANLHMSEDVYNNMKIGETSCYVGAYNHNDEYRCSFMYTNDGISFTAYNLARGENLTFAVDFEPDTFKVVLEDNYTLVVVLIIEVIIFLIVVIKKYLKWIKTAKPQKKLYKSTFVAPEYQPPEDEEIHVAEGEKVYIKKTKSSYVATLLELAVSKKITIKKVENGRKNDWSVVLNVEKEELTGPQEEILDILSGDGAYKKGDEIPIKKHKATRYLSDCAKNYDSMAENTLDKNGYLDKSKIYKKETSWSGLIGFAGWIFIFIFIIALMGDLEDIINTIGGLIRSGFSLSRNSNMIGGEDLPLIIFIIFVAFIIIVKILNKKTRTYAKYTNEGVKLVRYLEGLELYIKMAEEDRLKFLQSVEGADTSTEGTVKLYEKLLPWASLFGAEESWVRELGKYYEIENVEEVINTDVLHGIMVADISRSLNSTISSSTHYVEPSSGGGSSSSSSGGGGGGFSGGGGGGGGGGGW